MPPIRSGKTRFFPRPATPTVNGYTPALLNSNPNLNPLNRAGAANRFRLDRSRAVTADQDHGYTAEQKAFDAGLMDLFPRNVGSPATDTSLNLGYFDGNTVTALWNYAQHFAMSDNFQLNLRSLDSRRAEPPPHTRPSAKHITQTQLSLININRVIYLRTLSP
jgi:hypothetical protein